jgi:hypothetical protein
VQAAVLIELVSRKLGTMGARPQLYSDARYSLLFVKLAEILILC